MRKERADSAESASSCLSVFRASGESISTSPRRRCAVARTYRDTTHTFPEFPFLFRHVCLRPLSGRRRRLCLPGRIASTVLLVGQWRAENGCVEMAPAPSDHKRIWSRSPNFAVSPYAQLTSASCRPTLSCATLRQWRKWKRPSRTCLCVEHQRLAPRPVQNTILLFEFTQTRVCIVILPVSHFC